MTRFWPKVRKWLKSTAELRSRNATVTAMRWTSSTAKSLRKAGLNFSGMSPDGRLPEIVEWSDHPWFIGVQYHPELKSKPFDPHPAVSRLCARRERKLASGLIANRSPHCDGGRKKTYTRPSFPRLTVLEPSDRRPSMTNQMTTSRSIRRPAQKGRTGHSITTSGMRVAPGPCAMRGPRRLPPVVLRLRWRRGIGDGQNIPMDDRAGQCAPDRRRC